MTPPLSVFIITRNEEARIARTLAALRGLSDDIVMVDSGSTDQTTTIAEEMGAWVLFHTWEGYGQQKRYAEGQCRHPWLLNVDADEVVTPELAAEIRALLAADPPPGAYKINILTVYPGDAEPRRMPRDVNAVRLYHRQAGRYRDHPSYDRVEVRRGIKPGQLQAPLWHYPIVDWAGLIDKSNRFSSFQASLPSRHSDAMLKFRLYSEFPINFLKTYIGRRHFTGGWKGFYFALTQAFMRTSRIAKILEARQQGAQNTGSARGER